MKIQSIAGSSKKSSLASMAMILAAGALSIQNTSATYLEMKDATFVESNFT